MSTVALVAAFRRADRVGATVRGLLPLVDQVVVVDDGSEDGGATVAAAREAGATVVALPANRGKGGALAAGVAATPGAATYLLVDADTADTAAATAPLLDAVERGADLAIGVLPPAGGRGGFGAVRDVAAWGIRRACGFEAAAPLSGQRAVRGPLLRSLEMADRFGVEAGMTIDAVRSGAAVVEVPIGVEHAHTGRGVAGFSHRAAQGWDLVRALWPRLLTERSRRRLLVGMALVVVVLLTTGAAAVVPCGRPLGPADHVVLLAAPAALRLEDLDDPERPELASLAGGRGAVAAANVDVPGRTAWSTWATVGAGREIRARPPTRDPDPAQPFLVQDRPAGQGSLGDALRQAGRATAFVGSQPTSPVRLAVADGAGRIDRAASAGSFGAAGLVNRTRTDLGAGAAVVAVDAGDLDPRGLEELLAGLRPVVGGRGLLLLVTPADPDRRLALRPLVASGPGAPAGRLVSPSTRRDGLVVLPDVAPTILTALGLPVPDDMLGRAVRRLARQPDLPGLFTADRLARQRDTVWDPALLAVVPLHLIAYSLAWRRWRRRRPEAAPGTASLGAPDPVGSDGAASAEHPGRQLSAPLPSPASAVAPEVGSGATGYGTGGAPTVLPGTSRPLDPAGHPRPAEAASGGGRARAGGAARGTEMAAHDSTVVLPLLEAVAGADRPTAAEQDLSAAADARRPLEHAPAAVEGSAAERQRGGGEPGGAAPGAARLVGRSERWLGHLGLGLAAWPLATWLVRAAPGTGDLGRGAGLLALTLTALVVFVAWRLGRRRGLAPLALVLGATVALVTVDLGLGGPLQLSSAFGSAAHSAGRFNGLGNSAFAVYAGCALLALACASRRAPWMGALLVVVAFCDALPSLGADVGGALTLAPVFALATAALWSRLSWRTAVLAVLAAAVVAGAALAVDLSSPAGDRTHLARFVAGGGGSSSIGGKVAQNLGTYAAIPPLVLVVAVALGFAVFLWRGRFGRLLPAGSPARIGVAAALAVALVGNALNDSGPIVTLIALSLIGPYLVVRAMADEPPPQILRPLPAASSL